MPKNQDLLQEIASIRRMERGKVTVLRRGPNGSYYSHQSWENGKNVCKYVRAEKVEALQEAIANHERFQELTRAYADEIIARTRAEDAPDSKKNSSRKSRSPKTPKSSN